MAQELTDDETSVKVSKFIIAPLDMVKLKIADVVNEGAETSVSTGELQSLQKVDSHSVRLSRKPKRRRSSVPQVVGDRKRKLLKPAEFHVQNSKKVGISNLRDLLLWLLTDTVVSPRWIDVGNRSLVDKALFVFVPGVTPKDFGYDDFIGQISPMEIKENSPLPFFQKHFENLLPVQSPGSKESLYSSFSALTSVQLTKKEKFKLQNDDKKNKIYLPDLVLSYAQLIENGYPVHSQHQSVDSEKFPLKEGWVETKKFEHEGSKTFALDCEMCISVNGKELTRISIVDFNNKIIMDELVKPREQIIDYVTRYSGITEEKLKDVTTTLDDIQQRFISIISSDDILIGHSLESDLNVLKIRHPLIIDTALCFDHPRGPPAKASLKYLAKTFLHKDIQVGDNGHSSVEDSEACMELLKLKVINGRNFGQVLSEKSIFKSIFETGPTNKTSKSSIVISYANARMYDSVENKCERKIQCFNDDDVIKAACEHIGSFNLVVAVLKELEFAKGFSPKPEQVLKDNITVKKAYQNLDSRLEKLFEAVPTGTAIIICTGNGDPTRMMELQRQRKLFQMEYNANPVAKFENEWNEKNVEELREATIKARDAVAFLSVKAPEAAPKDLQPQVSSNSNYTEDAIDDDSSLSDGSVGEANVE